MYARTWIPGMSALEHPAFGTAANLALGPTALAALEQFPDAVTLSTAVRDLAGRAVDLRLQWMNARARAGQPDPAAAIGGLCSELWPQMLKNGSFAACLRVLDTGVPEQGEFYWTESATYRAAGYDFKGARLGSDILLWVLRDSTERVREALAGEARMRAIFDHAPGGIIVLGPDRRVVSANRAATQIFACAADELVGRDFAARCNPGDEPRLVAALRACAAGDDVPPLELQCFRRGGTVFLRLSLAVAPAPDDAPPQVVVHVQDITAHRHALHAMRTHILGELAGGIAHDFNNLLAVIGGNLELAREALVEPARPPPLEELGDALRAVDQSRALTRQILSFSRRASVTVEPVDIHDVIRQTREILGRVLPKSIAISTAAAARPCVVRVDRGELGQIVMNLAINARDAMPTGGRLMFGVSTLHVDDNDLAEWPELGPGAFVRVTVADTGAGMPPEVLARAFEPYFTTKTREQGTGLGLATVQAILTRAGGALRLSSRVGAGTAVRLLLPLVEPAPAPVPARLAIRGRIFVVDDDPTSARLVERLLQDCGAALEVFIDPIAALAAARLRPPNLLITDMDMPALSGPDLTALVQQTSPATRVVFTSGFSDGLAARSDRTLPAGAPVLEKPFTRAELLAAVARAS